MRHSSKCLSRYQNKVIYLCDVLCDLVPFVQFKICEKHPWRSVTFSKVAGYKVATLLKVPLLHGCISRFLNSINGTKSRNASLIIIIILLSYCKSFNPLMTNVPHHIETSQLTCIANQLTGFYMIENIVVNELKLFVLNKFSADFSDLSNLCRFHKILCD